MGMSVHVALHKHHISLALDTDSGPYDDEVGHSIRQSAHLLASKDIVPVLSNCYGQSVH